MATTTASFKLTKPDASDYYSIDTFNDNMDKIDEALKDQSDAIQAYTDQEIADILAAAGFAKIEQ